MRCCLIGTYWLTSSAPVSGLSDVIEYRIIEGQPANTLIGNVPVDAGLHTKYTARILTSFRYQLLPTDDGLFAVIFMRPSYRPHYRPHPYLYLSVCPSVCTVRGHNSKTKKCRKIKVGTDVPHGTSKWSASFHFERSKVKVTGRKNVKNLASSLLTGGSAGESSATGADCTLDQRHC